MRGVDAFQQRHEPLAFLFGVIKKFGDDNAGSLVGNITYAGFVTVFPLLLLAVTALKLFLAGHPQVDASLRTSILGQFPVIGPYLLNHIHALKSGTTLGLAVGIAGLVWGSLGLSQAGIFAMQQIWNIPGPDRPNYVKRLGRSLAFLLTLGVGVAGANLVSFFSTLGPHALWVRALGLAMSLAVTIGQFLLAYRVLTPRVIRTRRLVPGAVVGGVLWLVVQESAGYLVRHDLRHDSSLYGTFAIVLGLIAYIYLGARVAIYCAEINVVLHEHMWPRAIVQPPLTPADQESMARQALENQRRPEQRVQVSFTEPARLGSRPQVERPQAERPQVEAGSGARGEPPAD